MVTLRDVAVALERYRVEHGTYPPAATEHDLRAFLEPTYMPTGSWIDRWGHPLVVEVKPDGYLLSSSGDDGVGGHEFGRAVSQAGHSITLRNGVFAQYEASVERTARKYEGEIAAARESKALSGGGHG